MNEDRSNPDQEQASLRQNRLIYGGLVAIGTIMVQPFLTAESLSRAATVCVIAFAVALPLLAALLLVNEHEELRQRPSGSVVVMVARPAALNAAFVGAVAGFWHISRLAGVVMLAAGLVAVAVHSAGYSRLERPRTRRDR